MNNTGGTYFGQDELRLKVGTGWVQLEILTEVGVLYTRRGYAPALRVKRGEAPHLLLVGALSLAAPLEAIRGERGNLAGLQIRVRKMSEEQTSPYVLEVAS